MRWSRGFLLAVIHCCVFSADLVVWFVGSAPHLTSPRLPPSHTLSLDCPHTPRPTWLQKNYPLFSLLSYHLTHRSLTHSPSPIFLNPMPSFSETPDSRRKTRLLMFACLLTHYSINSTRKDTKRIEQNGIN